MWKLVAALAAFVSLSAGAQDYSEFVKTAKANLVRDFKDPASAQFRGLFVSKEQEGPLLFLCGEVNAKNSFGGYIGFRRFYASGYTQALRRIDGAGEDGYVFSRMAPKNCSSKVADVK